MALRLKPYQIAAVEAGMKCLERKQDKFIIQIPTGGGKTVVATELVYRLRAALQAKGKRGNILWIAHREHLLEQAELTKFRWHPDLISSHWLANKKKADGDIVFTMIGSTRTLDGEFDIVVVDEAHRFAEGDDEYENMYAKLLKRIQFSYLIGLTATPGRLDCRKLAFDRVAFSISFFDLVKKHRLARPIYVEMLTKQNFDLQSLHGEFTNKSLGKLDDGERNAKIAKHWRDNRKQYGKTILFAASVPHCYSMQAAVLKECPDADTRIIHGETPKAERDEILRWFAEGATITSKILLNCMVFTEGFDEASIKTVIVARPTKSKSLWCQMIGRGSRIVYENIIFDKSNTIIEPAGDDGVMSIKFPDGYTVLGELGDRVKDSVYEASIHADNEFYIVNVMDEITHYGNLVQDWVLDIKEPSETELEQKKIRDEVDAIEEKIKQIKKDTEMDPALIAELDDAQIRDIIAVLIFSDKLHKNVGVPLDIERMLCLMRLMDYAESCNTQHGLDFDIFQEAYAFCVLKGEFQFKLFECIRWAFFYRYVQKLERVENRKNGKMYDTWRVVPLHETTAASRADFVRKASEDLRQAELANQAFNTKYSDERATGILYRSIVSKAIDLTADSDTPGPDRKSISVISLHFDKVTASNRRLRIFHSADPSNYKMQSLLNKASLLLTRAAQEVLDDPTMVVTVVSNRKRMEGRYE